MIGSRLQICGTYGQSMYHNGSKFERYYVSRWPHASDSPDISPSDFSLFGMLKGVSKNREFNSSVKLKRRLRRSGMSSLSMKCRAFSTAGSAVLHGSLKMGESILLNKYEMVSLHVVNLKIGGRYLSVRPAVPSILFGLKMAVGIGCLDGSMRHIWVNHFWVNVSVWPASYTAHKFAIK
jgi:hypothetical protein